MEHQKQLVLKVRYDEEAQKYYDHEGGVYENVDAVLNVHYIAYRNQLTELYDNEWQGQVEPTFMVLYTSIGWTAEA